jgi:hypothetical protein
MKWLLVGLAIAGCASAGEGNSIIGGLIDAGLPDSGPRTDAGEFPEPDASPIDAPPQQVTLSQTVSGAIARNHTYVCFNNITGLTRQNSYYRVFAPGDHGITSTLSVSEVGFGIELASSGVASGLQPAVVRVGTYGIAPGDPTLDLANMRVIASVDIQIPDGEGTRMDVPIAADIPPTTNLIVELTVPDGNPSGHVFVIGSNGQGETRRGYTRAPTCNLAVPTTMRSIADRSGLEEADILLTVSGTHQAED